MSIDREKTDSSSDFLFSVEFFLGSVKRPRVNNFHRSSFHPASACIYARWRNRFACNELTLGSCRNDSLRDTMFYIKRFAVDDERQQYFYYFFSNGLNVVEFLVGVPGPAGSKRVSDLNDFTKQTKEILAEIKQQIKTMQNQANFRGEEWRYPGARTPQRRPSGENLQVVGT